MKYLIILSFAAILFFSFKSISDSNILVVFYNEYDMEVNIEEASYAIKVYQNDGMWVKEKVVMNEQNRKIDYFYD